MDISTLISRALALRGGLTYSIPHDLRYDRSIRSLVIGGINYYIEISFDNRIT